MAVRDPLGFNAQVYNDSIKVIMRGRYLDEECKIRDGFFVYYDHKGIRYMAGTYTRNMRTGWWFNWYPMGSVKDSIMFNNNLPDGKTRRYFASGQLEAEGEYKTGKINGEWLWYHSNGQLATREKYLNGSLDSLECFDSSGAALGVNCAINRPPAIKGRYGGVEKFVKDSLIYPPEALKKEIEGYVAIQFTVSKNGEMSEPIVLRSPNPLLSAEAIRVLKSIPAWYPAIWHNRVVDHSFTLSIPFFIANPTVPVTEIETPAMLD